MTAPKSSSSKLSSARWRSVARISAETSTGDFSPSRVAHRQHARPVDEAVRQPLVAGHVGQRAAHEALDRDDACSRGPRPAASRASWPICAARRRRGSAPPTAAARGPRRRAGTRPRRGAPRPPANAWCPGRCRRRCGAGAGPAPGRVRRSAAAPWRVSVRGSRAFEPALDVLAEARDEHQRAHLLRQRRRVAGARPASRPASASSSRSWRSHAVVERLRRRPAPAASSSASRHCHLLHQEVRRHRGVVLGVRSARRAARTGRPRA